MDAERSLVVLFCCVLVAWCSAGGERPVLRVSVGGNVTLREEVNDGSLLHQRKIVATVTDSKMAIKKEGYRGKVEWNNTTRYFTITNIQKNHQGVYSIDVDGREENTEYEVGVYEPPAPPSVSRSSPHNGSCSLLCSVDGAPPLTQVLWLGVQEVQTLTNWSVLLLVPEENLDSSFTCAARTPAEEKRLEVDVLSWCGSSSSNWLLISILAVTVPLLCVLLLVCVFWSHAKEKSEPEMTYSEIQWGQFSQVGGACASRGWSEDVSDGMTVYTKVHNKPPPQSVLREGGGKPEHELHGVGPPTGPHTGTCGGGRQVRP